MAVFAQDEGVDRGRDPKPLTRCGFLSACFGIRAQPEDTLIPGDSNVSFLKLDDDRGRRVIAGMSVNVGVVAGSCGMRGWASPPRLRVVALGSEVRCWASSVAATARVDGIVTGVKTRAPAAISAEP